MIRRTLFHSLLVKIAVGLGIGLVVIVLTHVADPRILQDLELTIRDFRYRQRGLVKDVSELGNVVLVEISDDDLRNLPEPYPFPRSYYAHVIENLNRAGARTIVMDRIFNTPSSDDDSLRATLSRFDNVILGVKAPPQATEGKYLVRSVPRDFGTVFSDATARLGAVNLPLGPDNLVRRYFPFVWADGYLIPSLAFGALNHAYRLSPDSIVTTTQATFLFGDREIPKADDDSFLLNYYGPPGTFRSVPFSHVIDDALFWTKDELDIEEQINTFDENLMRVFSNKVVLLGSSLAEDRDAYLTPMASDQGDQSMHGVEIHATAIQNVIDRSFVEPLSIEIELILILFLSTLVFVGILAVKQLRSQSILILELIAVAIVVLLVAGILQFAVIEFNSQSVLLNVVHLSLAVVLAYIGTILYQYGFSLQQKSVIKNYFSPYLNKQIVDILVAQPMKARLGGDKRLLTVFYTDIADFSNVSEPLPPEKLVLFLREYREEMSSIILKYGGTLDGFAGDTILAFWGAPIAHDDHARRACLVALEMQDRLDQIRPRWQRTGKPAVEVRIGIDTAEMIVGNMGAKERFDYTVIGESVNLVRRLARANKEYRTRIIISDSTYEQVQAGVIARDLDLLQAKGRTEPLRIWELLDTSDITLGDIQQQSLDAYHRGLRLFRERRWNEAIDSMQQAKSLDPTCLVAELYEQRASFCKLNPPPPDWNGVFTSTMK